MTRRLVPQLFVAMVCLSAIPVDAQEVASADPPAHVSFVDGGAVLERDGQVERSLTSMPLLAGDRIRTEGGRVEVLFADGSALHLDAGTTVDFQSDEVVRLLDGRIRLSIAGPARDVSYRVDAPSAWVQIADPGEYRVSIIRDGDVELGVLRGAAELVNERGRSYIRAGERTFARDGAAPSAPYVFNSAAWDSFDRWSEARRDQRLGVSAQYLPNDVRSYAATFDHYGSWRNEPEYGYVWYPRVQVGWRPYHHGRWVSLRPYGWTWVAIDPWGWPTHHYGRWGISGSSWFWIPGRHWSPAWVSWAYASDYVSWCPLGWNNRPVFQFINVNIYRGRRYSPWDGWTAVSRRHFGGSHFAVASASVRVDRRFDNTFVIRDRAPEARYAVARSQAPIRSAGRYAVPRGGGSIVSGERGDSINNRRLPAPSRAPRATSEALEQAGQGSRSPGAPLSRERSTADYARSRGTSGQERVAPGTTDRSTEAGAPARENPVREYRRVPRALPQRGESTGEVTTPPDGAVRAVPRSRQRQADDNAISAPDRDGRQDRRSSSSPSGGWSSPPSRSAPRSSGEVDVYRSTPGYRRAPAPDSGDSSRPTPRSSEVPSYRGGGSERMASPRNTAPSEMPGREAPSYRSMPDRPSPSRDRPSAAPAPRSEGGRPSSDGGGRQRSGGESSGGARRRGGN
jgi:hypothetical protein